MGVFRGLYSKRRVYPRANMAWKEVRMPNSMSRGPEEVEEEKESKEEGLGWVY